MLFPGSRIWYEGSAADLATLTEEVKSSSFSGHIILEFQDSVDVVICVGGEFRKVIERVGRRLLSTKKYREIWGKCQIKPGRMTVFELPPQLARRLRGLHARRLLFSGNYATGCDPARLLRERRAEGFTGFVDVVSSAGKLLLEFEDGAVTGCHYSEYEGLAWEGFDAFRTWHEAYARSTQPCFFFIAEFAAGGDGQIWDELLMDASEQVRLPFPTSLERLIRAFGRERRAGDTLEAGGPGGSALYLVEGRLELLPEVPGSGTGSPHGPGSVIGLGGILGGDAAPVQLRVVEDCRCISFTCEDLPQIFRNSPPVAARLVRQAARQGEVLRIRSAAYGAEPRIRDVELAVAETIARHGAEPGMHAALLFRELTQSLPLSLPEIDALFRELVGLGVVLQSEGRVAMAPRET